MYFAQRREGNEMLAGGQTCCNASSCEPKVVLVSFGCHAVCGREHARKSALHHTQRQLASSIRATIFSNRGYPEASEEV